MNKKWIAFVVWVVLTSVIGSFVFANMGYSLFERVLVIAIISSAVYYMVFRILFGLKELW